MKINTKADFDNLIIRINNLVSQYENNVLHFNQYQFYLANGEKISFEIAPKSIPHLLGVRLDYLRSTNLFKSQDSFELLKEFIDNSYFVYKQVQEGHLSFDSLFSHYIENKLNSFEKIIYYFSPDDIEFVLRYEKSKSFQLGLEKNYLADYFIAKISKNGDLNLLGIIRNGNSYVPMTNVLFTKDETQSSKLKSLLTNQTLTIVNTIRVENFITNFSNTSHLSLSLKLEKLKKLKQYSRFIKGVAIDVSSDYQFVVNGLQIKENKINIYKMVCQKLTQFILEHEIFSLEEFEESINEHLDDEIIQMVQAYNDEVCKDSNSKAKTTYTELSKQYCLLAKEALILKQQLETAKQEAANYYQRLQVLEQENCEYKEFQNKLFSLVNNQQEKQEQDDLCTNKI